MSTVFVKYCPNCGAENGRLQALCLQCNADLTMVRAAPRREEAPPAPAPAASGIVIEHTARVEVSGPEDCCVLELVADPAVRFTVLAGQTVGRTNAADIVLAEKVPDWRYISSCHARFTRRGAQWYVTHAGGTNFNIVDGTQYRTDDEVALYDNSVLVLSKTAFRVKIGGHDADPSGRAQ